MGKSSRFLLVCHLRSRRCELVALVVSVGRCVVRKDALLSLGNECCLHFRPLCRRGCRGAAPRSETSALQRCGVPKSELEYIPWLVLHVSSSCEGCRGHVHVGARQTRCLARGVGVAFLRCRRRPAGWF